MHLESPSSIWLHFGYVLQVIFTIPPDLCSGVFCVKHIVSPHVLKSRSLYPCMSIVENNQHNLTIKKLRNLVILMILLTKIGTSVYISMH